MNLTEYAVQWRDMVPHVDTLRHLASEATTIIELGVRGGVSSWAFLEGLPAKGRLWSVDLARHRAPSEVVGDGRWTFLRADDRKPQTWLRLPARADIVFIDTSHEYEHTLLELLLALSRQPRIILCHDADWPDVARAIDEFCAVHGWRVASFDYGGDQRGTFSLATLVRT